MQKMKNEFTFLSKDGQTKIHAIEWIPEGEKKAVLQLCHGMVEFIDRYDEFARFLTEKGFVVVGHDHLGHGSSVVDEKHRGYFDSKMGNEYMIGDIHQLRKQTQEKYEGLPYFILGHSMGSFLVRQYIELYGKGLQGAVVMGTGMKPAAVVAAGRALCGLIAAFRGWFYRSSLMDHMAFAGFNKKFEPSRTPNDWLTKDGKIVDEYEQHPWTGFCFTVSAYNQMFRGIQFVQDKKNLERLDKKLPLLIVSGEDDPVGNFGKGVKQVFQMYEEYGMEDVEMKLYPNDRHEILNETDRQTVYEDIWNWMEQRIN